MTPEEFIKLLAAAVAQKVHESPPKTFNVKREDENGVRQEATTLPQVLSELCDHMKASNILQSANNTLRSQELIVLAEMNKRLIVSNKLARQMLASKDDDD